MATIKQQMLSGVFYTAIAKYSGIIISLIVMAILARLLSPDDFGIVAIATVFINFFNIFTNIGISSAIVQNKELTLQDINNIYMFTLWIGVALSILFFLSTGFIVDYYQDDRLSPICQLLSVNLFFSSAGIVPNTLFYKDKNFKFIAWRTLIIQIVVGILAIIAAWAGASLYTLLIQPILSSALIYFISLKKYPQKFLWTWGINSLKKIWVYSIYQFLFSVMSYFIRNFDKILIGKYIGMSPLGYYEKSYRLMSLPIQNITYVITPVLHPILSDYQKRKEKLATINERMVHLLAFIGFPLSILLFFCGRELMLFIFGSQWEPSIPAFQILSLSVGLQIVMSSSGSFFQSSNDTRGLFICGVFTAFVTCTGFLVCILFFCTLEAFAYSMLLSYFLSFIQCYWQLYRYQFRRNIKYLYKQLTSPLLITLLVGGLLYVMEKIKVNNVIIGKQNESSDNYEKFKKIVKNKKIRVVEMGDILKIEDELYFEVLWPMTNKMISENSINNNSLVCKMNYKKNSILFTGDIEEIAEKKILELYSKNLGILRADILKVGHHGSKTSSSLEFINAINPKYALIGVGKDNKFGHPSNIIINRLENKNVNILRTDQNGEISIFIKNKKMRIKKFIEK